MPDLFCAHCETSIVDHSTLVQEGESSYCCNNCAAMWGGRVGQGMALGTCGHCRSPLVDPSSRVYLQQAVFCCNNCATAFERMGQAAGGQAQQR